MASTAIWMGFWSVMMWICEHVSEPSPLHFERFAYDLEGVCNNTDSHELLSVVTTVHHQGVGKTLDNWALRLSESLLCVSAGGMGDVDGCADLDVIAMSC